MGDGHLATFFAALSASLSALTLCLIQYVLTEIRDLRNALNNHLLDHARSDIERRAHG